MHNAFPNHLIERLESTRVVAGFSTEEVDDAVATANALYDGGIDALEVTLRTPAAIDGIRAIAEARPEMLVGVGTILTPDQVHQVKDAGAAFGVAPGLSPQVIQAARDAELPFAPGVMTPSDLTQAIELGLRFVKLFPAEAAGGKDYLNSLAAPFASYGIRYFPFGGVKNENVADYLSLPAVAAVGGTWIAPASMIAARDWAGITRRAEEARATVERLALSEVA
ncbi:bifunctional 4-hydroxy-2-oxoglutarate aldolase/2-dehydro-3-deoxy-phosphogluconate aldolase [Algisphaera agarilytica]|uniref:2-dehydro-3-deoxy-phosphogluconate aldolase n=1 Tax=Algisphaera agarilytica TaxID=1385975 RepID=A0A7X0H4I8_9BACT|nr:bifunctional 4-hydroxy-2-oxoglutarate aldolase/2-dehydro-3-deoxy-phosphogluconate aldolase [Algisphaera agarilytica]MBB6429158.1 2-dehydro-3-deoxyphosphogluconate aldolase/(4S)-4-hydroxy-2-oxoglutarate aldolase [Algisphaera agarilytica]